MRFGNLEEAVGSYQQGTQWAQQQQQQRQQQAALLALGKMLSQPNGQPQGQPQQGGGGMTPDQSAQAAQTAQGAAQIAGWPQAGPGGPAPNAAPASPVANPTAVLNDPTTLARLSAMAGAQGGTPQGQQMPVPGAPSMAQPREPMKQPPVPGLSSTAQPDAAGMDDPVKAAQQSIQTIASGIKAANPNIDPATLALATQQQIETIKGVSPLTKAAMTAQMSLLNYQLKQQTLQQRMASEDQKWQIARQNANTREERNQIDAAHFTRMEDLAQGRIDASERNTDVNAGARVQSANIGAGARIQSAQIGAGSRERVAETNQQGAGDRAAGRAGSQGSAADKALYGRVYASVMANSPGTTPEQAAAAAKAALTAVPSGNPLGGGPPRPVLTPRTSRGGAPSSSRGPVKVSGPDQIRKLPKGTPWVSADGSRSGVAP